MGWNSQPARVDSFGPGDKSGSFGTSRGRFNIIMVKNHGVL
jgi:hypothetical protein